MKDDLTKKEQAIMDAVNQDGQVQVDDLKTLQQLAKKLEKTLGKASVT